VVTLLFTDIEGSTRMHAIMIARGGDLDRARTLLEESLMLGRHTGEPRAIALAASNLTQIALDTGELKHADALNTKALTQAREIESLPMIATALQTEALIALQRGDPEDATSKLPAAIETIRTAVDVEAVASLLSVAGTHSPRSAMSHCAPPISGQPATTIALVSDCAKHAPSKGYRPNGSHERVLPPPTPRVGMRPGRRVRGSRSTKRSR
jgi:hypothetical protein